MQKCIQTLYQFVQRDHKSYSMSSQVNHLALNTDYALRTGAFDPSKGLADELGVADSDALKEKALQRYTQAKVCVHYRDATPLYLLTLIRIST